MPTYEFRCPDGHTFDRFFRSISSAEAEVPCPECGKLATRQMSAGAGLLFKGSGFYLTDYGKNAHRGEAPTDKSKKTESPSETKPAESKPAAETKTDSSSKSTKAEPSSGPSTSSSSSSTKSDT